MKARSIFGALAALSLSLAAGPMATAAAAPAKRTPPPPIAAPPPPAPAFQPSAAAVKAHVSFLASDLLEGRNTGTRGYDIAAEYVASHFAQWGLKPGGPDGSFFQKTPLVSFGAANEGALLLSPKDAPPRAKAAKLVFGEDYLPSPNPVSASVKVDAPLVFVGFGVVSPERGRDDYAGLDVKGKIVVALRGAPKNFQTEERAYFGNGRVKRMEAAKRGAVGLITVFTPTTSRVLAFERLKVTWQNPSMAWREASGAPKFDGAQAVPIATMSMAGGAKLFEGAATPFAEVMRLAELPEGDPPRFDLPFRLSAELASTIANLDSANVVGIVEGSDPVLKNEAVVLSAHLDHIGMSKSAENGDAINNGALDNAAGTATMLEAARGFAQSGVKSKRTLVFVALTAEERGLTGSDYFAQNPPTSAAMVANVNLDMPVLLYDFTDIIAFGAERSTLGPVVKAAAEKVGVTLSPDPIPDEGLFTRSDHFSFVLQGVPSVFIKTGFANGGEQADKDFRATRYHRPGDDLKQAINYEAGAKFARVNYEIARALADAPQRPSWNAGDFFGARFGKR